MLDAFGIEHTALKSYASSSPCSSTTDLKWSRTEDGVTTQSFSKMTSSLSMGLPSCLRENRHTVPARSRGTERTKRAFNSGGFTP